MDIDKMTREQREGLLWRCIATLSLCQATEEEGQGMRELAHKLRESLKEKE